MFKEDGYLLQVTILPLFCWSVKTFPKNGINLPEIMTIILFEGVDDATSECDLDDYTSWDLIVSNNDGEETHASIKTIIDLTRC